MKKRLMRAMTFVIFFGAGSHAFALPVGNLGFESGLTGYTLTGFGTAVNTFLYEPVFGSSTTYTPREGDWFVQLDSPVVDPFGSGVRVINPPGSYTPADTTGVSFTDTAGNTTIGGDGAILSTDLTLAAGEIFRFDWAFLSYDVLPFNDFSLFIGPTPMALLSDTLTTGDLMDTGWQTFTWTPSSPFSGTVSWVVSNGLSYSPDPLLPPPVPDVSFPSVLLLDNIYVGPAPVPEPGTLALVSLGLAGLGVVRVRGRLMRSRRALSDQNASHH